MAAIQITDVMVHKPPLDHFHGAHIELPAPGESSDIYVLEVGGWALGRSAPVMAVEAVQEQRQVAEAPVTGARPDIAAAFSGAENAASSGFTLSVGALSLREEFDVLVRAHFESDLRLPLGEIRGTREPLRTDREPRLQPILINTIGRSGSTWLAALLDAHPEIAALQPFAYDTRAATYWISVLQELAQPASFLSPFDPPDLTDRRWWLGQPVVRMDPLQDARIREWLGLRGISSLAALCQEQIESFYINAAGAGGPVRYFVEKCSPWQVVPDLLAEVYPGAKELILVRDFRDVLCSILAFNAKRGYQAFGRDHSESDEAYVASVLKPSAEGLLKRRDRRGDGAHVVRYEDLVADPNGALTSLFRYLGVDSSPGTVDAAHARASREGREDQASDRHRTVSDPGASIGRWQRDLPDELVELCNEALGHALTEFGYSLTGELPKDAA